MSQNGKPKIAFFDFTSCEGCQLTVVDSLQTYPELLEVVEIVQFREAMSERGEDYQVAFIEGSCTRQSDEARLQADPPAGGGGGGPGRLRSPGRRQRAESAAPAGRSAPVRLRRQGRAGTRPTTPARSRRSSRWISPSRAARSTGTSSWPASRRCCWARSPRSRITRCAWNASCKENTCLYTWARSAWDRSRGRAARRSARPTGNPARPAGATSPHPNDSSMRDVLAEHGLTVGRHHFHVHHVHHLPGAPEDDAGVEVLRSR